MREFAMWDRIKRAFTERAEHITVEFVAEPGAQPVDAYAGYIRLWLVEGFLTQAKSWGNAHFPALHGGATLTFSGVPDTPFAKFSRAPEGVTAPGAQLNFALTPLLPFEGGIVEMQAALYRASTDGPLSIAVDIVGSLAPLLGPPLSNAAAIVSKVGDGLSTIFNRNGYEPVLAVHYALGSPGSNAPAVRPGHLVVANTKPGTLGGPLRFRDGLLHVEVDGALHRADIADFLVLRVECRTEHDSWHFPQLEAIINMARTAYLRGQTPAFENHRTEAVTLAFSSPDLTPLDRRRVALLVGQEIDAVKTLGFGEALPRGDGGVLRADRLVALNAPELAGLTLRDLLADG